jgi:uncharacterized membrane protein YraQ (UPF0718 family)
MARYTVLFLILGLAVGLWLGFNPQAHQQTVQQWDSIKTSFMNTKAQTNLKLPNLSSNTTTTTPAESNKKGSKSSNSTSTTSSSPSQPSFSFDWNRVTTAFQDIWSSLQRTWANITAKINTSK